MTRSEIEKGTTTIYEAAFSHDDVFVKVDILHKGRKGWDIYEVKSSTELKDVYVPDAAIQYHVLTVPVYLFLKYLSYISTMNM